MSEQTADYEAYARQGRSALWLDTGQNGNGEAEPRLLSEGPVDLGFGGSGNPVRDRDLKLLRAVIADDESEDKGRPAFEGMLEMLESPRRRYEVLSPKQREWLEGVAEGCGVDVGDPAERNAHVPRGREVAPAQPAPRVRGGSPGVGARARWHARGARRAEALRLRAPEGARGGVRRHVRERAGQVPGGLRGLPPSARDEGHGGVRAAARGAGQRRPVDPHTRTVRSIGLS